jgi:hypothetical protein
MTRLPDDRFVNGLAKLTMQMDDGQWYKGWLLERVQPFPPLWNVAFHHAPPQQRIYLGSRPVRFNTSGSRVQLRDDTTPVEPFNQSHTGTLVELRQHGDLLAVMFDDGSWKEDVFIGSPNLRFLFTGASNHVAGTNQDGEPSRKRRCMQPPVFGGLPVVHVIRVTMALDQDTEIETGIPHLFKPQYVSSPASSNSQPVSEIPPAPAPEQRASEIPPAPAPAPEQPASEIPPAPAPEQPDSKIPPAPEQQDSEIQPALEQPASDIEPALEQPADEIQSEAGQPAYDTALQSALEIAFGRSSR